MKPGWITEAEKYIGLKEVPGAGNNSTILKWWKIIKRGGIQSDAVPWCAAFVGAMLETAGIASSRYESAKSYLTWGAMITVPVYGCVVVFTRDGGGHVGFVVGVDEKGRLMVLGGNQGDTVSIAPFERSRVAGYRWPAGVNFILEALPIMNSAAASSANEK